MSTAIAPTPQLPNAADIDAQLRELRPSLVVYRASAEWLLLEVFGLPFYVPPDLGGKVSKNPWTGADTVCDGTLGFRDRDLRGIKDSSGKQIEGQTAADFVRFACNPEKYGSVGLVWLPGRDAAYDAQQKALSRQIVAKFKKVEAESVIEAWQEHIDALKKKNKKLPKMGARQRAAEEYLLLLDEEAKESFSYECDFENCGYGTNEWEVFALHMAKRHGQTVQLNQYQSEGQGVGGEKTLAEDAPEAEDEAGAGGSGARKGGRKRVAH